MAVAPLPMSLSVGVLRLSMPSCAAIQAGLAKDLYLLPGEVGLQLEAERQIEARPFEHRQ